MFDDRAPEVLIGELEECHRRESTLIARRMSAIAGLLRHRTAEAEDPEAEEPGYAVITGFARASAEVAAVMNLAPMTAATMVGHAEALDLRLPEIAALLAAGRIDWRTALLIITRTALVGADLMPLLDRLLADKIEGWGSWSRQRVTNAVDGAIAGLDPDGVKDRRVNADTARHLTITTGLNGMAQVRGNLPAPAAAVVDKRLTELASAVCSADPRTLVQRRVDALYALSEGRALECECALPECPRRAAVPAENAAAAEDADTNESTEHAGAGESAGSTEVAQPPAATVDPPRSRFVINVIATAETLDGTSQQPGYLEGFGVIDADQVRAIAANAALRLLTEPDVSAAAALTYQPSAALERWIRSRDLTCRFPGCDRPAWRADIDHTTPFDHLDPRAGGRTVAANTKCYCRQHHLLKTFHGGPGGWRDTQLPDGTVVLTSPTGRVYRTTPDGADLFAQLRPACARPRPRRRSRERERSARILAERSRIHAQRPINVQTRELNAARAHEIDMRQWRNDMRKTLFVLKSGRPSASPWCGWVNEPLENPNIGIDWKPPPLPPRTPADEKPPF